MPAAESGTLRIEGALDVEAVPQQWPRLRAQVDGAERIDLTAVSRIDSAGVALLRCLQALAQARTGVRPKLAAVPARLHQICLAHRIGADGD